MQFLEVQVQGDFSHTKTITVPFEIDSLPFAVNFDFVPGKDRYYLLLNRFWPWATGPATSAQRRITEDQLPAGVKARLVARSVTSDVLY